MSMYLKKTHHNNSRALLITFAFGVAIGLSVAYALFGFGAPSSQPAPDAVEPETPLPSEQAIMTDVPPVPAEAKADVWPGRYLMMGIDGTSLGSEMVELLQEVKPGAVVLRDSNLIDAKQAKRLVQQIKEAVGFGTEYADLPLIAIGPDSERIAALGLGDTPTALDLAKTKDARKARDAGRKYAEAAVACGINVILAPVLDVLPQSIAKRSDMTSRVFGDDQRLVAVMGLAYADGIVDGGAIPVGKFYPGIGTAKDVDGRKMVLLDAERAELAKIMFPFNEAANRSLAGMMVGHVAVPALDKLDPQRPAALSPVMVDRILREYWNYSGVIVADDVALNPMTKDAGSLSPAVAALTAGCDAVMFLDSDAARVRAAVADIQAAMDNSSLPIDERVKSSQRLNNWVAQLQDTDAARAQAPTPDDDTDAPAEQPQPPQTPPVQQVAPAEPDAPQSDDGLGLEPDDEQETVEPIKFVNPAPPAQPEPAVQPAPKAPAPPIKAPAAAPEPPEPPAVPKAPAPPVDPEEPVRSAPARPEAIDKPEPPEQPEEPVRAGRKAEDRAEKAPGVTPPANAKKVAHKVVAGDKLSKLAEKYRVKVADIQNWNSLENDVIKLGAVLTIYTSGPTDKKSDKAETTPVPERPVAPKPEPLPAVSDTPKAAAVESKPVLPEETQVEEPRVDETENANAVSSEGDDESAETSKPKSNIRGRKAQPPNTVKKTHVVGQGETLPEIARRYGVRPTDILDWNSIQDNAVKSGSKLVVYAPADSEERLDPIEQNEQAAPASAAPVTTGTASPAPTRPQQAAVSPAPGVHVIAPGDTLRSIAGKYGITTKQLIEKNNIKDPNLIKTGQKLIVN